MIAQKTAKAVAAVDLAQLDRRLLRTQQIERRGEARVIEEGEEEEEEEEEDEEDRHARISAQQRAHVAEVLEVCVCMYVCMYVSN